MIRLLILILVGFVVYSMISGLRRPGINKPPKSRTRDGEQMVEDPQCGTYLPISDSVTATIAGQQLHFCSKKCLKDYRNSH